MLTNTGKLLMIIGLVGLIATAVQATEGTMQYRVKELERKVAGMQQEINKLHAVLFEHRSINHPISYSPEIIDPKMLATPHGAL